MTQSELQHPKMQQYPFLKGMYQDAYFPDFLVDRCKDILIDLCFQIETQSPKSLEELYTLSHAATDSFNEMEDDFLQNGSEIETAAREIIAVDFEQIALAYGFEADIEELIATREW
ncbi:DUF5713 family protein [Pontibacter sp. G13]|uniref:DUF5713 family protein n=1 Tax=Pontibacter sp. G13 TaxID=3074898 RepID=UPI002889E3D7|nr:DUF5713 family protein [Pontibacter sp. G13]WNJ17695.1 DUF5713 family protein [Pontibacter sp. G13]